MKEKIPWRTQKYPTLTFTHSLNRAQKEYKIEANRKQFELKLEWTEG